MTGVEVPALDTWYMLKTGYDSLPVFFLLPGSVCVQMNAERWSAWKGSSPKLPYANLHHVLVDLQVLVIREVGNVGFGMTQATCI